MLKEIVVHLKNYLNPAYASRQSGTYDFSDSKLSLTAYSTHYTFEDSSVLGQFIL